MSALSFSVVTSSSSSSNSATPFGDVKAAFDATAEQRAALFPDQLHVINTDMVGAARAVSDTFARIKMMREDMLTLPKFDIAEIDRIPSYVEALIHAQTVYASAAEPTAQLPAMVARATKFRDQFTLDVRTLAGRELIDAKRLDDLKGGVGYLATASDLGILVNILSESWDAIQGKTGVSAAELEEAQRLYPQIILVSDGSTHQAGLLKSAGDDRARAWTLLANAYEQVRRASGYFRFEEDDTDKLFPSLWAKKGAGRPAKKSEPDTTEPPVVPATPVAPAPVAPVVPAAGGAFPAGSFIANG